MYFERTLLINPRTSIQCQSYHLTSFITGTSLLENGKSVHMLLFPGPWLGAGHQDNGPRPQGRPQLDQPGPAKTRRVRTSVNHTASDDRSRQTPPEKPMKALIKQ